MDSCCTSNMTMSIRKAIHIAEKKTCKPIPSLSCLSQTK